MRSEFGTIPGSVRSGSRGGLSSVRAARARAPVPGRWIPACAGLVVMVVAGGGCRVIPPEVRVTHLGAGPPEPGGVPMEMTFELDNRNGKPIPLERVSYRVTTDSGDTFVADRSPELTVSAYGTRSFAVPVVAGSVEAGGSASVEATVLYRRPGLLNDFFFDLGLIRPRVRVSGMVAVSEGLAWSGPGAE